MTNNVPPPPRQRRGILSAVPVPQQPELQVAVEPPTDNMQKPNSGLQDCNFKVDPEFHLAFKTTASLKGMSMRELLEASFRCWLDTYGDDRLKALFPRV